MAFGQRAAQQRNARALVTPAPTGGMNDIDPIATMDPKFCLQLNNMFPATGSVNSRRGYREWTTGLGAQVDTLITFNRLDGTQQQFACTNNGIYDVSSPEALVSPTPVAVLTYGAVRYAQFSNIAGQYLIVCNGVDPMWLYNGTTWTQFTETMTPTNPGEISGFDPRTIIGVVPFKNRLWFIQSYSMNGYYLDTDAIAGTATPFYLGSVFKRGGYLYAITTWSYDSSGIGLDDQLIFLSSIGEMAIYRGTNPNIADEWHLVSVYYVSPPVGNKPNTDLGGDLITLTRVGLVPFSTIVQGVGTRALFDSTLSRNISRTLNQLISSNISTDNWSLYNLSTMQAIAVVIPSSNNRPAVQYIMNTLNGAWCRYTLPARCVNVYNNTVYFGSDDGKVYLFGEELLDGVKLDGTGGIPVECSIFHAYNYFGDPTTVKNFKLIQPILQANRPVSMVTKVNVDFDFSSLTATPLPPQSPREGSLWDIAIWDQSLWATNTTIYRQWLGATGVGFCAALLLKISAADDISYTACSWTYEPGNAI